MRERAPQSRRASHLRGKARSAKGDPLNILMLSGGGGAGAFGAGVLAGWSRFGTRPRFQIVTGVSVGALIAPFAFLGPAWDHQLARAFESQDAPPLLEPRPLGRLGTLFGWSAFRGTPLRALVNRYATPGLLRDIAAQAAAGRLLLVATTDLDSGDLVVWNMGAIASHGGQSALRLFRRVLVASASIPGDFPPVLIRVKAAGKVFDEMHVDGAASSAFLFVPGIASDLPQKAEPLHGATIYLIINSHLHPRGRVTPNRTAAILSRSEDTELASDARARVRLLNMYAARQGMRLNVTAIPSSYRIGSFTASLEPAKMKALFAYGRRCAREGRVWGNALTFLTGPPRLRNRPARVRDTSLKRVAQCPVPITTHDRGNRSQSVSHAPKVPDGSTGSSRILANPAQPLRGRRFPIAQAHYPDPILVVRPMQVTSH